MLAGRRHFCRCIVALVLLLSSENASAAEAVAQKATVFGTPTANLRAGPGVEHALKLTLKEGDPVTIEKLEGEWFLVTAADGQKGYIHKNLLKPVDKPPRRRKLHRAQKSGEGNAGGSAGQPVKPNPFLRPRRTPPSRRRHFRSPVR